MDLNQIMTDLGHALEGQGLYVYVVPPKSPETPSAWVMLPDPIEYSITFGGTHRLPDVVITVAYSIADRKSGFRKLADLLSSDPFRAALLAYSSQAWNALQINRADNVRVNDRDDPDNATVILADLHLTIHTT